MSKALDVDCWSDTHLGRKPSDLDGAALSKATPLESLQAFGMTRPRPVAFIVLGGETRLDGFAPFPEGVELVDNPAAAEAVVLRTPYSSAQLYRFLERQGLELAPVADVSGAALPCADYLAPEFGPKALQEAAAIATQILERTAELPPIPPGADKAGLLTLAFAYTRARPLEATYSKDRETMVGYPLLKGIADARRKLEELADAGLLRRRFFDRFNVCPACDSSRLNVREECPACRSSHLRETTLVHHYACGHQAPEDLFRHRDELECPKCRKQLRHYGVDYDRPGPIFVCIDCGAEASEPEVGFMCADCGTHTVGECVPVRDWFHYDLQPEGAAALRAGTLPGPPTSANSTLPVRHLLLLGRHHLELSRRFDRPFMIGRIGIVRKRLRSHVGGYKADAAQILINEILRQNLRSSDVVANRPNEIVIVFPETSGQEGALVLKRVCKQIRSTVKPDLAIKTELLTDANEICRLLEEIDESI